MMKGISKEVVRATGKSANGQYITSKRKHPDNGGETALRTCRVCRRQQQKVVNNNWSVPYLPSLSMRHSFHINAELWTSRTSGIKHIFKYICKDHDRARMGIIRGEQTYDEITNFQDARFVSASEAA